MNRILSLIVTILFALCIEAGIFMLIAHWWGMTAAITVIAIECVLALWTVYEMSMRVMNQLMNNIAGCG